MGFACLVGVFTAATTGLAFKAHAAESNYVGVDKCSGCHANQVKEWQGSHHDLAMQEATEQTVLADFNNTEFNYFGTVSKFFKKANQFWVTTDGPDGELVDYPIRYTFGVYPLQQYLIEFPGGRLQALNVVWDSRATEEGGQRWFHLYPNEKIDFQDELHWTGLNQNWNYMCADCHSTGLNKNYDVSTGSYNTTWQELDVSCEACHGPAEHHVTWAESKLANPEPGDDDYPNKGFILQLDERINVAWAIDPQTGNAKRSQAKVQNKELEVCAACHSRRITAHPEAKPGQAFLDNYQLSLLTPPLYHVDGQINDEVYVYGSFIQSKMHQAGVTCSDCHQPHSLKLRAEGNQLCSQCHLPTKYDNEQHHLHASNSAGSECVNCHMPAKNFMVIDARRDHSLRIPRPDLTASLGVPNACNNCHQDKTPQWAAQQLQKQHGDPAQAIYPQAISAALTQHPQAEQLLSNVVLDESLPTIWRATAVSLLPSVMSNQSASVLQMIAQGDEPLMGYGLATGLNLIPEQYRTAFAVPLLYDAQRLTRELSAQALAGLSLAQFPEQVKQKAAQTSESYLTSQVFNAERPEALTNIANIYARENQSKNAVEYYQKAIEQAPFYTPAYANLADTYRHLGDEQSAQKVLQKGISNVRQQAPLHYALGLSLIREGQLQQALEHLRKAADGDDAPARYRYVYAIGLDSSGNSTAALQELEKALQSYPYNPEILSALVAINLKTGNEDKANFYKNQLM